MDTFAKEVTTRRIFVSLVNSLLLKGWVNSCGAKALFLLELKAFHKGLVYRIANRKSQKLSPFEKKKLQKIYEVKHFSLWDVLS